MPPDPEPDLATLAKIKTILAGGANWCKRANAVDSNGKPVSIHHHSAVKWDIYGALKKATFSDDTFAEFYVTYNYIKNKIPPSYKSRDIEAYNDDANWAQILELIS